MKNSKIYKVFAVVVAFLLMAFGWANENIINQPTGDAILEKTTDGYINPTESGGSGSTESPGDSASSVTESPGDKASDSKESAENGASDSSELSAQTKEISEDGIYSSKEDVSLYIHTYGRLPKNYITKKEARELGWPGGNLEEYAPGKCIGGDEFYNFDGQLPDEGRKYQECDIDTLAAKSRGAKRLVYSDDGYIYYTADHYDTFEQLY